MTKLSVSVGLPFLSVGLTDIKIGTPKRGKTGVGPFQIVSRANGLALTVGDIQDRPRAYLRTNNAERSQFWFMRSCATKGAALLTSAEHELALDEGVHGEEHPNLYSAHGESWQQWRLQETSDGVGYLLQCVHSSRFLSSSVDGVDGWQPWYDDGDPHFEPRRKEWLFLLAYGAAR